MQRPFWDRMLMIFPMNCITWATRDSETSVCTTVLLENNRKCVYSWVLLFISVWSTWSEIKSTLAEEAPLKYSQDNPQKVGPEMEDSDSEKWKETAWSHMELLVFWKSVYSMCQIVTVCIFVRLVVWFVKRIWRSTFTSVKIATTYLMCAKSKFPMLANYSYRNLWLCN